MQRFNSAGRGPSPVIPLLLMVLTLVLVLAMNGGGGDGGRRETCSGGRGGSRSRSVLSSIRGLPAVVIAIVGIHYFLSVVLPSYRVFPAAAPGNRQGDVVDEGYGLGTILFLALFLILYNFF